MDHYTPRKMRPWALTTMLLRGLIRLLELSPLLLLVAFFISPVAPHLRIQYRYLQFGTTKLMTDCDYLGPKGFIKYTKGAQCPLVVMIDIKDSKDKPHLLKRFFYQFFRSQI